MIVPCPVQRCQAWAWFEVTEKCVSNPGAYPRRHTCVLGLRQAPCSVDRCAIRDRTPICARRQYDGRSDLFGIFTARLFPWQQSSRSDSLWIGRRTPIVRRGMRRLKCGSGNGILHLLAADLARQSIGPTVLAEFCAGRTLFVTARNQPGIQFMQNCSTARRCLPASPKRLFRRFRMERP